MNSGQPCVYVHTIVTGEGEAVRGMDALSAGIRIAVTVPDPKLRAYVETENFLGLANVLAIVELFDQNDAGTGQRSWLPSVAELAGEMSCGMTVA